MLGRSKFPPLWGYERVTNEENSVAWSVMYLSVGHLMRRFEFEVAVTSEWDMGWKERNAPKINRGLRAVIRKREF